MNWKLRDRVLNNCQNVFVKKWSPVAHSTPDISHRKINKKCNISGELFARSFGTSYKIICIHFFFINLGSLRLTTTSFSGFKRFCFHKRKWKVRSENHVKHFKNSEITRRSRYDKSIVKKCPSSRDNNESLTVFWTSSLNFFDFLRIIRSSENFYIFEKCICIGEKNLRRYSYKIEWKNFFSNFQKIFELTFWRFPKQIFWTFFWDLQKIFKSIEYETIVINSKLRFINSRIQKK